MAKQTPILTSQKSAAAGVDTTLVVAVVITVTLWASAFAGIRAGLKSYSPESVALLRYLTASMVLGVYALITRMPLPARRDVPRIVVTGFLGFSFYNVVLNAGELHIEAGTASLIVASAPIYVALLAGIFYHERLKLAGWIGILISFFGVAVISVKPGQSLQFSMSALLVLAAAISQAIYTVAQKPLLKRYTPHQFASYAIWAGTFFLLIFIPGLVSQIPAASLSSTLAVVYMGVFPGAIGYACWSLVLTRMPASTAGSFLYLIPAAAILIAWIWLGEVPASNDVLGGGLVTLGVIVVNLRGKQAPGYSDR
jgi:drug/metabolite transporter (DMT)-like permease